MRTRFEDRILPLAKKKYGREPFVKVIQPPKRNRPCPCGSGKKFKKCCYLKQFNG